MFKRRKYKTVSASTYTKAKQRARRQAQIAYIVDGIVDFRLSAFEKNRLEIKVHWEGYGDQDNSWVAYEELYTNEVLKAFVKKYRSEHQTDIFMMLENLKQNLKAQIRTTLRTKSSAEISRFIVQPFDYLEYQVMQAACHLLSDRLPDNMIIHLSNLVFKNYFFQLEKVQHNRYQKFLKQVKKVSNIDLEIENFVDFDMFDDFTYIPKNIIPCQFRSTVDVKLEHSLFGCSCDNKCSMYSECCPKKLKKPFSYRNDCRFESKDLILKHSHDHEIIECGPFCDCSIRCRNRVTQRVPPFKFVLFKTLTKGWGVKARNLIKQDSFLFEYCGEFIDLEEADKRMSQYMFAIAEDEFREYTIDAGIYGNIARFVNHSCKPNLVIFKVNDCRRLPENSRLCLFALRDILPEEELTINYRPSKSEDDPIITNCDCGEKKCRKVIK